MRNRKFVVSLDEKGPLSVGKVSVAVDPSPGLCRSFPVIGVGGFLEGPRGGEEIEEAKKGSL